MTPGYLVPVPMDQLDERDRSAAIRRLNDLFSGGGLQVQIYSALLDQVFSATSRDHLEAAMLPLPPVVRLTAAEHRLVDKLVLQVADGHLQLGSGWQLAAKTTIRTGVGSQRIDLTAATWDSLQIDLHLETWGPIEVVVPHGVAVQLTGTAGRIQLEALSAPICGAPVLRISSSGPAGVIRIRHPDRARDRRIWRGTGRILKANRRHADAGSLDDPGDRRYSFRAAKVSRESTSL
ncbi:MAG: hypothetical protein WAM97_19770 [Acidimicrobiales bacterium]